MTSIINSEFSEIPNLSYVYGAFTVGSAGAPTLVTTYGQSNALSVTRTATGTYAIGLSDKFLDNIGASVSYLYNGVPVPYTPPEFNSGYSQITNTFTFRFFGPLAASGPTLTDTLTDPDSGSTVYFELIMRSYA